MRLAHARRTALTLVAGSILLAAAWQVILAATAGTVAAAAPAGSQSCEPLQAAAASPSPSAAHTSATPTAPPTTAKATATPTPTATTATPAPTTATATPTTTPTAPAPTTTTPTPAAIVAAGGASGHVIVLTAAIVTAKTAAVAVPRAGAQAAASTAPVSLCVEVLPLQQSPERGQAAQWAVAAWATGGTVPDVTIQLLATPVGSGTPSFSFGCPNSDGTSSCNLGAVDAGSVQRQLQAQITVPLTAATVSSASLTATASAANLTADPQASASITILPPPALAGATTSLPPAVLPGVSAPNLTLSPGGNASGLFPTLAPQPPQTAAGATRQLADTSAATPGAFPIGAQAAGLAALALAFVVAVTRVSVRRPAPQPAGATAAATPPPWTPADPPQQPEAPEDQ